MTAPPRHEARHVVTGNVGEKLILTEEFDHERKLVLGAVRPRMMLADLLPIALGNVVELERGLGRRQLRDQRPRLLALGRLYFFGFAARRAFRRAVKPMTSHLEVEMEVRRATVSVLVDGHGTSFRVWLVMNSSRSVSAYMRRRRFVPLPMLT